MLKSYSHSAYMSKYSDPLYWHQFNLMENRPDVLNYRYYDYPIMSTYGSYKENVSHLLDSDYAVFNLDFTEDIDLDAMFYLGIALARNIPVIGYSVSGDIKVAKELLGDYVFSSLYAFCSIIHLETYIHCLESYILSDSYKEKRKKQRCWTSGINHKSGVKAKYNRTNFIGDTSLRVGSIVPGLGSMSWKRYRQIKTQDLKTRSIRNILETSVCLVANADIDYLKKNPLVALCIGASKVISGLPVMLYTEDENNPNTSRLLRIKCSILCHGIDSLRKNLHLYEEHGADIFYSE